MDGSVNGNIGNREISSRAARSVASETELDPGSTANSGIFDYDVCLGRLGGDRELFDEILQIFLEDVPQLLAQGAKSLAGGDFATLERTAHTLKGLAANFAAAQATDAAYAVELHARERRPQSAAACFPRLEAEVHRLESALRSFQEHHS